MDREDFIFIDQARKRTIPVSMYIPSTGRTNKLVIFGPGYQDQATLQQENIKLAYHKYEYLASYFTDRGYSFISIQHDMPGDIDGIDSLDPKLPAIEARWHLWLRGEANIFYVIQELSRQFPELAFERFIIAGHSHGGDIARFFANRHPGKASQVITLDARRCPIEPGRELKLLMFEANDTEADPGVIPPLKKRFKLEWMIVKPKNALHISYNGEYISQELQDIIYQTLDYWL